MKKMHRSRTICSILSIIYLLTAIPPHAYSGNLDIAIPIRDLEAFDDEVKQTEQNSSEVLRDFGAKSQQEVVESFEAFEEELKSVWDADLDVYISLDLDIEAKRRRLKNWVEVWRDVIDKTTIEELKTGIGDALSIAEADGLDVEKLTEIYDKMKKAIRESSFVEVESRSEIRNRSAEPLVDLGPYCVKVIYPDGPGKLLIHMGDKVIEFGQLLFQDGIYNLGERALKLNLETDERLSTKTAKAYLDVIGLGWMMEQLHAEARARQQKYRTNLYKRTAVAYIRSLIYGDEMLPECDFRDFEKKQVRYDGHSVVIPKCPESMTIKHLREYLVAVRDIQAADMYALEAQVEEIIAEQEITEFIASFIPLVGEAIDIYAAYTGEDLAGYCVTGLERAFRAFFGLLPIIGPRLFKLAMKTETGQRAFIELNMFLFELPNHFARNLDRLGLQRLEAIAKYYDIEVDLLVRLRKMSDEALETAEISTGTQFKQRTWRTVKEQIDAEEFIEHMPAEMRERAMRNSDEAMDQNLLLKQGMREDRIARSHMVPGHIEQLEYLAAGEDAVLMYRSVNPDATRLLDEGVYTKWMNVKGKSSDWGVQRAYIPRDQRFSKLGNPAGKIDDAKIKKFQAQVDDCLPPVVKKPCFGTVHLEINGDPVMIVKKADGTEVPAIYNPRTGRYLEDVDRNLVDITDNLDTTAKPREFEVLADDQGNPLTADYDFLSMGFRGQSRGKRVREVKATGEVVHDGLSDIPRFDPERGYITERESALLEKANRACNRGGYNLEKFKKGEFVNISHHGPETGYPGSPGALDLGVDPEITAFDPIHKRFLVIPRCDYECMVDWCKTTGKCGALLESGKIDFCKKAGQKGCIPPDPNRLLKDYIHKMRLHEYTLGPNSVWPWGHYNPVEGWSFLEYLANLKEPIEAVDGAARRAKRTYVPPSGSSVASDLIDPELSGAAWRRLSVSSEVLEEAIFDCRKREQQ
jgi:hypothetical protein